MRARSNTRWVSLGLLLGSGMALATACGSEDGKKKTPPVYEGGGDGNDAGSSSTPGNGGDAPGGSAATPTGGAGATAATGATGGVPGEAGSGAASPAGVTSTGGAGGAGGAPTDGCPAGFDDCDSDPSDCETPVNTLTQCGGCAISCSDDHGTVACTNNQCVMSGCTSGYGDCDADGTTGCEESLDENDTHCGDCLRDCAAHGAVCNTSMCTPVVVDASASGFTSHLAGGALYMMTSGAMPVSNYTLQRIPVDGSARKQVWAASGNIGGGALWADATDVYWAVSGTPPSVLKKAAAAASDDLPIVLFQPDAQPHWLTAQGVNFYWASNKSAGTGFIYARSKTAASNVKGAAIVSVDQGNFTAFMVSPTTMYWIASQGGPELRMAPIAGGTPTPVPDAVVSAGASLFLAGETLYFVRSGAANALNGIYSYTAGDTTVKQLVASNAVVGVIVDERGIYYKVGGDYHVYKAKLTGSAGVAIANSVYGGDFTGQDDTFIYQIYPWGSSGPAQAIIK